MEREKRELIALQFFHKTNFLILCYYWQKLKFWSLMLYRILVINPKYEKTKIAVYENEQEIFLKTIYHSSDDLIPYKKVCDQM